MNHKEPKQCVYCLRRFEKLTKDHVFPKSWYPDSTEVEVERWTVPACRECNNKYSHLEQELLIRMALCLNRNERASSGIPQRALDSMDPAKARDQRDGSARLSLRKQTLRNIIDVDPQSSKGLLPNFGLNRGSITRPVAKGIKIPEDLLESLARKFVRGITYRLENNLLIDSRYVIDVIPVEEEHASECKAILDSVGASVKLGPGVEVQRAVGDWDTVRALFRIVLWNRWIIYSVIESQ